MIVIRVQGAQAMIDKMKAARKGLSLQGLYKKWGLQGLKWVNENFETEGGLLKGSKWRKLRPNTVAGRRKGSRKILQDTGNHLKNTFTYRAVQHGVYVGTASKIAPYHNFGTAPYDIRPKNKKALCFTVAGAYRVGSPVREGGYIGHHKKRGQKGGRGKGEKRFAMVVHHPGLPARRMLPEPGDKKIDQMIMKTTENHLDQILKRAGLK